MGYISSQNIRKFIRQAQITQIKHNPVICMKLCGIKLIQWLPIKSVKIIGLLFLNNIDEINQ
jgi:hypothetical protein